MNILSLINLQNSKSIEYDYFLHKDEVLNIRKKENTLEAERWNERGGLQASRKKASRSTGPLPAFSVFVDEECAIQNERQEIEHGQQMNRQKQVRDERTFRERPDEGKVSNG